MPRKVELYLAIYLPKWLSQLGVFAPSHERKRKAGENVLFGTGCLFSAGQNLAWVPVICGCV